MRTRLDGRNPLPVNVRDDRALGFRDSAVRLVGEVGGHGFVRHQSRALAYEQAHQFTAGQVSDMVACADAAELDEQRRTDLNPVGLQTLTDRGGTVERVGFDRCRGQSIPDERCPAQVFLMIS